jgi:alginate O-acetyltransferase complex protein AlgI
MKLVMADRLAVSVDSVYSAPLAYSGLTLFITSVAYSLQLLFDFAGYSDMAIAVAYLLGFDLDKNFNLPYLAASPAEFWRRWHISLSTWLRDYVYIPLGGNRRGRARTYINTFITMTVSGLWHGSTVNFLIWGMLHGLWQIVYRAISEMKTSGHSGSDFKKDRNALSQDRGNRLFPMLLNFLIVNFLWIPFRASTLNDAWTIFSRIITFRPGAGYYYVYTFIFGGILLIVQIIAGRRSGRSTPLKPLPLDKLYGKVIFCCLIIAIAMFAYFGNSAFIYAQF